VRREYSTFFFRPGSNCPGGGIHRINALDCQSVFRDQVLKLRSGADTFAKMSGWGYVTDA
jgi:hypothetical protein